MDFNIFKRQKNAQIGNLVGFVITLVIVGFVVAIGLTMMGELSDTTDADSWERNATDTLIEETAGIADWYGIIVLALIALVILSIVMVLRNRAVGG